jgi:pyridoxine 5'-phosphate synthase PdxJ
MIDPKDWPIVDTIDREGTLSVRDGGLTVIADTVTVKGKITVIADPGRPTTPWLNPPPAQVVVAAEKTTHEVTITTRTYKDGKETTGVEHAEYQSFSDDPQAAAVEIATEAGKQIGKDRFRRIGTDT